MIEWLILFDQRVNIFDHTTQSIYFSTSTFRYYDYLSSSVCFSFEFAGHLSNYKHLGLESRVDVIYMIIWYFCNSHGPLLCWVDINEEDWLIEIGP